MQLNEAFKFEPISRELSYMAGFLVRNYGGNVKPPDILGMQQDRPMDRPVLLTRRLAQTAPPTFTLEVFDPSAKPPLQSLTTWVLRQPEMQGLAPALYNSFEREIQEGLLKRGDVELDFRQLIPQLLTEQPQLTPIEVQA